MWPIDAESLIDVQRELARAAAVVIRGGVVLDRPRSSAGSRVDSPFHGPMSSRGHDDQSCVG